MGEQSILMQSGRKHAGQRRVLGQAFTREAVDGYAPLVEAAAASNLDAWAREGCVKGLAKGKDLAFEVAARALAASGGEGDGEGDMSPETMEAFRHDFDRVVVRKERFESFSREVERRERVFGRKKLKKEGKKLTFFLSPSSSSFSRNTRRAFSPSLTTWEGSRPLGGP